MNVNDTYRIARDRLWALKSDPIVASERDRILARHVEQREVVVST